jgi:hypothetical protein
MKYFTVREKIIASHVVLAGLIVLAFIPPDEGSNNAEALGWAIYFTLIAVVFVLAVKSWIEFSDMKRNQYRQEHPRKDSWAIDDVVYFGTEGEPYDWAKEIHDPWAGTEEELKVWDDCIIPLMKFEKENDEDTEGK